MDIDHMSYTASCSWYSSNRPHVLLCLLLTIVVLLATTCVVKPPVIIFRVPLAWANRKLDNILRFVNLQLFREWECRHRHKDRELCADSDCCRHTDCVLSTVSGMTLDISMQTFAVIWQTVIYSSLPVSVVLCYIAKWRYIWAGRRPAGLVTLMFILQCEQERRKWHVYTSIYCFSVWINVLIG